MYSLLEKIHHLASRPVLEFNRFRALDLFDPNQRQGGRWNCPPSPTRFLLKICLDWESLTLQKAIDICHMNKMAASQQAKMEETDTVHHVNSNKTHARLADPHKNP